MRISPIEIVRLAFQAAQQRKALDPVVIDIHGMSTFADYFFICSADNYVQLRAICEQIEKVLQEHKLKPRHIEGYEKSGWVLMDYNSVIIHIFLEESRQYYALENLWGDAERVNIE